MTGAVSYSPLVPQPGARRRPEQNKNDGKECDNDPPAGNDEQEIQVETVVETQSTHFENQQPDVDSSDDNSGDNSSDNDTEEASVNADREAKNLESNLGNYWNNDTTEEEYKFVINTMTEYGNLEATLSTPQYGFNKGMKVFGKGGYGAAIKELDENLIGRNVVRMLTR